MSTRRSWRSRSSSLIDPSIEAFIEALWLEDGLSANTQAAYRRDLAALATWLAPTPLDACSELKLFEYAAAKPAGKATTAKSAAAAASL